MIFFNLHLILAVVIHKEFHPPFKFAVNLFLPLDESVYLPTY